MKNTKTPETGIELYSRLSESPIISQVRDYMINNQKELFWNKNKDYVPNVCLGNVNFVDLKITTVGHSRKQGWATSDNWQKGSCRLLESNIMKTPDFSCFEGKKAGLINIEVTKEESALFGEDEARYDGTHILQFLKYKFRNYDFPGLEYAAYLKQNPKKAEELFKQSLPQSRKDEYLYAAFIGSAYFDQEGDQWLIPQFLGQTGLVSSRNPESNGKRFWSIYPTKGLELSNTGRVNWSLLYETANNIKRTIVVFER